MIPVLVIAVGNPSRGDDALGPLVLERLEVVLGESIARGAVELLTDFQLQVELIFDLTGRERVIFVDASITAHAPFCFGPVGPSVAGPETSHALSPAQLLGVHERLLGPAPPAWLLAIRGEGFELGEGLSPAAAGHLELAVALLVAELR